MNLLYESAKSYSIFLETSQIFILYPKICQKLEWPCVLRVQSAISLLRTANLCIQEPGVVF